MRFKFLSDEKALELSSGEVKNSGLINYKTNRPQHSGLLGQNIFGPINNFTCDCKAGSKKYNFSKKGSVCPDCGTEIEYSSVRQYRMGHISLPLYVINPFAYELIKKISTGPSSKFPLSGEVAVKFVPSAKGPICTVDGISGSIVFYEVDPSDINQVLNCIPNKLYSILDTIDLEATAAKFSGGTKGVLNRYIKYGSHPRDWIIKTLLVLPAGHREMVEMGDFNATSPVNELYSRIMRKVLRINTMIELNDESKIDTAIFRAEARVMQKAVNGLFMGGMTDYKGTELTGIVKGFMSKEGRFRGNLLGKRVDFSGRSVITADPKCKLNEIGLPEKMCWELFKPFVIQELRARGQSLREATYQWKSKSSEARSSLYDIISMQRVLINRAPSLHKYNVQAYVPHIVPGKAILMAPMCCAPFNADFDGDCISGEVKIPLLNGRDLTIPEMIDEYGVDSTVWVYSKRKDGSIVPAQARVLGRSGVKSDWVTITFSNGEVVKCHAPHEWMMADGSWKPASSIQVGDKMSNLRRRISQWASREREELDSWGRPLSLSPLVTSVVSDTIRYWEDELSVLRVTRSNEPEMAYDLEVPIYHNFATRSGVFTHNTVAVHVVLSSQAKEEVDLLLTSESNVFSSATGSANLMPSHEMIIGLYVMTNMEPSSRPIHSKSIRDLELMMNNSVIKINTEVNFKDDSGWFKTCLGRLMLSELFKTKIDFVIDKKKIRSLIDDCKNRISNRDLLELLYNVSTLSFKYATQYGFSVGIDDIKPSSNRSAIMEKAEQFEREQLSQLESGANLDVITERVTRNWFGSIKELQKAYIKEAGPTNPVVMMYNSGARVSMQQISQITVLKGMFSDVHGKIDMTPIKGSLSEGLTPYDYFRSCSGSRKSLSDKKSMTPKCGYLTRKLVTLLRELYITEHDCGSADGVYVLTADINGRSVIDEKILNGKNYSKVRSPITCHAKSGICQKCYGNNLATDKGIRIGTPVGTVSAQSLTEPATQMSMRSFHTSGAASLSESKLSVKSDRKGIVSLKEYDDFFEFKVDELTYCGLKPYIQVYVSDGAAVEQGSILFTYNESNLSSADIGGVFPRLEAMYELRSISDPALIATCSGEVKLTTEKGRINITVGSQYIGSSTVNPVTVPDGIFVEAGTKLTSGAPDIRKIFEDSGLSLAGTLFIDNVVQLYTESGLTAKSIHVEMVFRGLTEIVVKNGLYSLRSRSDFDYDSISIGGVNTVCTRFPTPLKKMGYGYTIRAIQSSINSGDDIEILPSEKIMMGCLTPSVLEDYK